MSFLIALCFFGFLSCFLVLFAFAALLFLLKGSFKFHYWSSSGQATDDIIDAEYTVAEPIEVDDDGIITIEALPVPDYEETPKSRP